MKEYLLELLEPNHLVLHEGLFGEISLLTITTHLLHKQAHMLRTSECIAPEVLQQLGYLL